MPDAADYAAMPCHADYLRQIFSFRRRHADISLISADTVATPPFRYA